MCCQRLADNPESRDRPARMVFVGEQFQREDERREDERAQLRAVIYGDVQGVGFRYWTRRQASELGLTGYVRNMWNGTVEVVAEGRRSSLQRLLNQLGQGPRSARVQEVRAQWRREVGRFRSFGVRH
jgi:acylphosphatase